MAMRKQTGGSTAIQYDDFQPKSEWKEEEGANILHIHLPDFQKEQLKITYVHSLNSIRAQGERPVAYNKWSRFNQAFPVPKNCEVNKIHGKVEQGVLIIIMPKTTLTPPVAPAKKEDKSPPKEASVPPKPASTSTAGQKEGSEKPITSPPPQKPAIVTKAQKGLEENSGLQEQEATKQPYLEKASRDDKQKDGKSEATDAKVADKKAIESSVEANDNNKLTESELKEKAWFDQQEEIRKKGKEPMITESSEEGGKKRKETMETKIADGAGSEEKAKKEDASKIAEKVKEVKNVAAAVANKAVKGLAVEKSEEKQALVNIGAAVLVIVALGAYIAYSYQSSGNAHD